MIAIFMTECFLHSQEIPVIPYNGKFPSVRIETGTTFDSIVTDEFPDIWLTHSFGIHRNIWRSAEQSVYISLEGAWDESYNFRNLPVDIRGRGNSTWRRGHEVGKAPYRIRFPSGMGRPMLDSGYSARNWSFLAELIDKTQMKNYVAYVLGSMMDTFTFTPFTRKVHLYINGDYRGVYTLVDHMDNERTKVHWDISNPALSEFYLEWDVRAPANGDFHFLIPSTIPTSRNIPFAFRHDSGITSNSDPIVIEGRNFMNDVFTAIRSRDMDLISEIIDIPSMIDFYIVKELYRDSDVDATSVHMTVRFDLDGDGYRTNHRRLHMGPLWDFDSMGTSNMPRIHYAVLNNEWFYHLLRTPEFKELVRERFEFVYDEMLPIVMTFLDTMIDDYYDELMRNHDKWDLLLFFPQHHIPAMQALTTYNELVDFFKTNIIERAAWMLEFLNCETDCFCD